VTALHPRPNPRATVTVFASSPDSSGVLPALGQVGAFMLGLGTLMGGAAALVALIRRRRNNKPDLATGS
jgi:hypothetical protein